MLCVVLALSTFGFAPIQPEFAQCGLETLELIKREFKLDRAPGFADKIGDAKKEPLFNWGAGVLLSAFNAAARVDPKYKADVRSFVEACRSYWNPEGPVPGFDVWPMPKPKDRYYDDNAWMVLALVESYEILDEKAVLKLAEDGLAFVLSGGDSKLGGGIYWRENEKKSKNTCSNGPAAAACLAVFSKTKRPDLLAKAKELYAWTLKRLQDPNDALFWDNIDLQSKVEKTKWSYNTALMIRTAAELSRFEKDEDQKAKYLAQAQAMADQSEAKWFVDGKLADVGKFAHLLLESWNYVPTQRRVRASESALHWLWERGRTQNGFFGPWFNKPPGKDQAVFELIDQASAARAFLVAARDRRS